MTQSGTNPTTGEFSWADRPFARLNPADARRITKSFTGPPGLYLHIPFCESICPFCPYNKVRYQETLVADYFSALEREIQWYLGELKHPFSSLYIGGGTPTLCLNELGPLIEKLPVEKEKAIEVLPTHATNSNISKMQEMGINYLSLGIQSFDERVLRHLQRPTSVEDNENALLAVIGRFDCVDVDLIFDVAFEAELIFLSDLEKCFRSGVEQVSTYPLMRFGYTPFGKTNHQPEKEHEVLRKATELAHKFGYERRSVWTFNRKNAASYTSITREFYLGCGAGAGSYTGRLFFLNHFSLSAYIKKVEHGQLPIARTQAMSSKRSAAYYLFWQAYTGELDLVRFDKLFPGQLILKSMLNVLRWAGLMERDGDNLVLTDRGYDRYHDLERWVTYHFIEPLWSDMMREHEFLTNRLPKPSARERIWLWLARMNR